MGVCVPKISKCDLNLLENRHFLLQTGTVANKCMSYIVRIHAFIDITSSYPSVCQISAQNDF